MRLTYSGWSSRLAAFGGLRGRWEQLYLLLGHLSDLPEEDLLQGLSHEDDIVCGLIGGEAERENSDLGQSSSEGRRFSLNQLAKCY